MNRIKKIVASNKFPYIVLFCVMLFLALTKNLVRDDINFANFEEKYNMPRLLAFLKWRYHIWSSRLIVEAFLVVFVRNVPWLWKILDPIVYVILAYNIWRVFVVNNKNSKSIIKIIVCLILIIPQIDIGNSGWVATALNYLWPVTFGIMSFIPIKKCIDDEKLRIIEIPVYIGAIIFACNVEQVAAVVFTVYVIFTIYFITKKKINPLIIVMLLISMASMIFILTCPGNASRTGVEIKRGFLDYPMLNTIDKIFMGLYTIIQHYVKGFNPIYVIFTFLIMINIFKKYKNLSYRIIAILPFFMGIAFNSIGTPICQSVFGNLHYNIDAYFSNEKTFLINYENFDNILAYIPIILSIVTLGCIISSIYLLFRDKKKEFFVPLLIICAGMCSKFIMGFSVTVFTSDTRTSFIFIISMIILSIMILDKYEEQKISKISNILAIWAFFMVINNLCLCLNFTA